MRSGGFDPGQRVAPVGACIPDLDPDQTRPAGPQLIHRAAGHQPTVIDDRHGLAQLLHELELMRGEQHRHTARRLAAQHFGHHVGRDQVKPCERLIENQQVGVIDQRGRELDALLVAV